MDKVMASAADAVADIPEGASLAVGGFGLCGLVVTWDIPAEPGQWAKPGRWPATGWLDGVSTRMAPSSRNSS